MPLCVIISDAHSVCVSCNEGKNMYTNDQNPLGELFLKVRVECSEITSDKIINSTLKIRYLQKKLRFEHCSLHDRGRTVSVKSVLCKCSKKPE